MSETKLTVRLPQDLLEKAKLYADQQGTTLQNLIRAYLRRLSPQSPLEDAPIVRSLSGILSQDVSIEDYKSHIDEKKR